MQLRLVFLGVLVSCAAACGSPDVAFPVDSSPLLTRTDDAGSACAAGGQSVRAGRDENGNGALEDSEIERTTLVCNSAPKTLVVTDAVAPGSACAEGGVRVRTGVDANGDGKLDAAEVAKDETICAIGAGAPLSAIDDLAPGATCAIGGSVVRSGRDRNHDGKLSDAETDTRTPVCELRILSRVTAAPADAKCAGGSTIVESGRDKNANGTLDDAEVESKEVQCGTVVDGDLLITDDATLVGAKDVVAVKGFVRVGGSITALHLPALRIVGGDMDIGYGGAANLTDVQLDHLANVGGALRIHDGTVMKNIALPELQAVQQLAIQDDPLLETVLLPQLVQSAYDLGFARLPHLTGLALPSLRRVGGTLRFDTIGASNVFAGLYSAYAVFLADGSVTSLDLGSLGAVESNVILAAASLATVNLRSLASAPSQLVVRDSLALHALSAPNLATVGELDLWDNAVLDTLDFPALYEIDSWLYVSGDAQLASLAGLSKLDHANAVRIGEGMSALTDLSTLGVTSVDWFDVASSLLVSFNPPYLRVVTDELTLGMNGVGNAHLTSVDLPSLVYCNALYASDDPVLARMRAPKLREVPRALVVKRDPVLPTCDVDRLRAALSAPPGVVDVAGTDGNAACSAP